MGGSGGGASTGQTASEPAAGVGALGPASGPSSCARPPGSLPLASQELAVVEDLLYVLVGVDGRCITAQPLTGRQGRTFLVDPNLDLSIKELVNRILPVAASYSTVTR